jgi:hypothetical protein
LKGNGEGKEEED